MRKYSRMRQANINDPFTILLAQLSGVMKPPKAQQAFQQYMHYNYREGTCIADVVDKEWQEKMMAGHTVQQKCNTNF